MTDWVFALWSARDGILQPESKDDEIEHFVDVPDEDSADTALDTTPGPNSESNGASEDNNGSDSDAELGEDDMVDRSIPDLDDDGNDSNSDEEGGTKRKAQKGSKIAKLKTPVVASQRLAESTVANVPEEPGQKTWPVEGYYNSRHRDPSYWYDE